MGPIGMLKSVPRVYPLIDLLIRLSFCGLGIFISVHIIIVLRSIGDRLIDIARDSF